MTKIIVTVLIIFSLPCFGQVGGKNFIDQNYIDIIGTAKREVVPDKIYISVMINEKDNKAKETLEELEQKMIHKLKELGINVEKQLVVKDLASNFKFYFLLKADVFTSKEYEILVHDAQTAGRVIVQLQALNISNISIDRVEHSKLDSLRLEVKKEAVKNAKAKAEALTSPLDQHVGKALFIQEVDESGDKFSNRLQGRVAGVQIRGASSLNSQPNSQLPNINFENIKIEASVQIKFALE